MGSYERPPYSIRIRTARLVVVFKIREVAEGRPAECHAVGETDRYCMFTLWILKLFTLPCIT